MRTNDRRLLFADVGIVTMRPSDVPTYVEAGAADLGIVGKDVLMEQRERQVFELLDLGYGGCTMVLATVAGEPDPAAEALRRLGVMRVATKYPRLAARWLEDTGRQAEIVEVKGSVELAPLTGLVEAIVDLTATGTTLRENGLVVREEIVDLDGAADRQPGRPQAQGGGDRRGRGGAAWRLSASRSAIPAQVAARVRALAPGAASVADAVAGIVADVRARGDAALSEYVERFDDVGGPLRVRRRRAGGARSTTSTPRSAPASRWRSPTCARWPSPGATTSARCCCPQGQVVRLREVPVRRAAIYVPGGRAPYPSTVVMGVVTARAAGVEEVVVCAPGAHPVILAACALCEADAVFRMGGAHAVAALAYGTESVPRADVIAGPGNLYVQEAKRLVSGDVGIDGFAGPSDVLVLAAEGADPALVAHRPRRPGRARRGHHRLRGERRPGAARRDRPSTRGTAAAALVDAPDLEAALDFAEAFAPEHLELDRRRGRGARAARAQRRLRLRRAPRAPRPSATTSPARTTRCPPAGRRASPPG